MYLARDPVFPVLKRSVTVSLSSLDVLFGSRWCVCFVCLGFLSCFWLVIEHPVFCIFTCSPTARDQNRYKKKCLLPGHLLFLHSSHFLYMDCQLPARVVIDDM